MIVEAGAYLHSYANAAFAMTLAGLSISAAHVRELTLQIGTELAKTRDDNAKQRRRRQGQPRVALTPEVVAVEVDGGRLRTRQPGSKRGVHQRQNKEDKIACLVTLRSVVHEQDPQPEPPPSFLLPRRVQRLVRQMAGLAGDRSQDAEGRPDASSPEGPPGEATIELTVEPWAPRRLVRTCVASMADSQSFGPMVAGEAHARDFYRAKRRAFVADGQAYNWTIQKTHFWDFEAITDFLHVLCYVYSAAWAVGGEANGWSVYVKWLRACWQGRVAEVIAELRVWQERIGVPPEGEDLPASDPRRVVSEGLVYLENNKERMDYPRYRREGLPMTSSLVESLVGEFNARVKGRQKFWNRPDGAEGILQVRAAMLSHNDQLTRHFAQRPGCPYRRRPST